MAGIIAGEDDGFDPKHPSSTLFAGVAPDAKLLNMKVATGDGGADVSQIIAAIDWVVAHRDDSGMHVRVLSLSYGTESTQPWQVDPLAKAVENAWNHGILVVASAGNDGLDATHLLMPAADPHVLAVGAADNKGTATTGDDVVADFTNGGNAARRLRRARARQVRGVAARSRFLHRPAAPRGPRPSGPRAAVLPR